MTDTHAATELRLYIDNDGTLYRQRTTSILKNLIAKRARGQYKHDLAVKLFGYLVAEGAKKYVREYGSPGPGQSWHQIFDAGTRRLVAEEMARYFETEAKLGHYNRLLPKKYQLQEAGSGHARKKLQWKTPESIKVVWSPMNQTYLALWPSHGSLEDQQVLKVADAAEMAGWLRDTYGAAYGLVDLATTHHAVITQGHRRSPAQLDREIKAALGSRRRF